MNKPMQNYNNLCKNLFRFVCLKALSFFIKAQGVLPDKRNKKQWVFKKEELMGGKMIRPVLFPNGISETDLGSQESQAITQKDFWTCVSNSLCRIVQLTLQVLSKTDAELKKGLEDLGFFDENGNINISQRALAVMSGTVPGKGNSMYKVAETARKLGLVSEKFCPTLQGMTQWEFFNLPAGTYAQAKKFLELVNLYHEDLLDSATPDLFTYGAVQSAVSTPYNFSGGVVQPPSYYNYNHAITWYGLDEFKRVCDSYPEFFKKFALGYAMRSPKIIYASRKKKTFAYPLIQFSGGIYVLAKSGVFAGKYLGFNNPDVYKAIYGEYKDVKRVLVSQLPDNMVRDDNGGYILKIDLIHDFSTTGNKMARLAKELNDEQIV